MPGVPPPLLVPPNARAARRRWPWWLLAIGALLAAGGYGWSRHAAETAAETAFVFTEVSRGTIEALVTATGTLQPRDFVDVGAQVSGQLRRIHVKVGDTVAQGDLLAEIDATVLQSRVDATRAGLRSLRAQLKDREATLSLAQLQLRRQRNLIGDEATTLEAVQQAEAALRSAEAQIEQIKAQIEQTESNLRADSANLQYTRIVAPMAGTVVSISARQGQTLNTNQQAPTLMRIADLGTMTVETQVSEADITRLKVGTEAYFTTLGGGDKRWQGQLSRIEPTPTVTNNVVLYKALFEVPNPDGQLMTQMTAQVFFIVDVARDALLVPMSAITPARRGDEGRKTTAATATPGARAGQRAGNASDTSPQAEVHKVDGAAHPGTRGSVQVAAQDGKLETRDIVYGVSDRIHAAVLSGLAEGERVVSGPRSGAGGRSAGNTPRMSPRL